jgi:hypothetical protein
MTHDASTGRCQNLFTCTPWEGFHATPRPCVIRHESVPIYIDLLRVTRTRKAKRRKVLMANDRADPAEKLKEEHP